MGISEPGADEITEPTVHLCWNVSAISRAAEVLQAAGLDIMAADMAAHLPPPPPADKAMVLSYFEIACDNQHGIDELADGLLRDLVRVGWMRVPEPAECPQSPTGMHNRVVARDGENMTLGYTHCGYCGTKR